MSIVSILLPVYNGEKTLKATLESLLNQTFVDFELLIGIDGTNDSSKAIAESFEDSRIKIFQHPKNLGLADNLNTIIAHASPTSRYFAMAEQDDVYETHRLQLQVAVMKQNNDIGLVSGIAEFKSEDDSILFPGILVYNKQFPKGKEMFRYLYINQLKVVNTCMLWRKSLHIKYELKFNNTYGNFNVDWDFVLRFSLLSNIHGINKKLVTMSRGENHNSVTTNKKFQHEASRRLIKDFKSEFPDFISLSTYKKAKKVHVKIELGYNKMYLIFLKSIYYSIVYKDLYFLQYFGFRLRKLNIR